MVMACLRLHGAMVLRQVEALLMVWLRWVILWVPLQWEATRWEMLWVVPQWAAVLRWVILGPLHLLLMEQWLLWIPQRLRIWLKAWKQLIQLLMLLMPQLLTHQLTMRLLTTSCNLIKLAPVYETGASFLCPVLPSYLSIVWLCFVIPV